MPDFNVRSDSVNVEQIMEQIRARIREKRGVDYTEEQIRELAAVKLEKFLDPDGVRSDLVEQFRRHQPQYGPPVVPSFAFEDTTMFETHRGALGFIRKLLHPILKLFFNPNALIHALHTQVEINRANVDRENQRRDMDALSYEVIHNLVLELTRTGIEVKNLKMRVESLSSRLDFNERRARSLESLVVYKPAEPAADADRTGGRAPTAPGTIGAVGELQPPSPGSPGQAPAASGSQPAAGSGQASVPEGPGQRSRRRRRRRGRRSGAPAVSVMGPSGGQPSSAGAGQGPSTGSEASPFEPGADANPAEPAGVQGAGDAAREAAGGPDVSDPHES